MLSFKSQGTLVINGKKTVYVLNPFTCNNFDHFTKHKIFVDKQEVKVIAVETRENPPYKVGLKIGLCLASETVPASPKRVNPPPQGVSET